MGHATKISAQWNKLAWGTRLNVSVKFIARLTSVNTIDRQWYGYGKLKSRESLEKQIKLNMPLFTKGNILHFVLTYEYLLEITGKSFAILENMSQYLENMVNGLSII